ncbi:hypothetical protein SG34_008260 [Thalassomonas viridans]|uniref:Uncharacterized protein n=1 Tax=Thalassomonas viridans TaxID=137584 RepID=A0AAE9Z6A1_9GAMM|nr:hypothetical protein [Thalassomonas viridans]WDE06879.1 hypothetical protein SG34_008260 [Thalassomonas viridans]
MFLGKKLSLLTLTVGFSLSLQASEYSPISIIECGQACDDIYDMVTKVTALEDYQHDENMLFIFTDSGVEVNSITYGQYTNHLSSNPLTSQPLIEAESGAVDVMDAALSCEYDRDYDCEAWNDIDGTLKPYIISLQNAVNSYEWSYTVTQDDIDRTNMSNRIQQNFAVGALTFLPVAKIADVIIKVVVGMSRSELLATMVAGGVTTVAMGELYKGPTKSKLKAGDILILKGGKITTVIRNGTSYSPSYIASISGGSGDGNGSNGGNNTGGSNIDYEYRPGGGGQCYRTFSNGQIIYVPCP